LRLFIVSGEYLEIFESIGRDGDISRFETRSD